MSDKETEESANTSCEMDDVEKKKNHITVRVVGTDVTVERHFKVKMTTLMGKLKNNYSESVGTPMKYLRFLFDGHRISDEETPQSLDMEDDDIIDVYEEQIGGLL